jgi:uncharacterized protein YhfF
MSDSKREQVILAAVNATGSPLSVTYADEEGNEQERMETDAEWSARVTENATRIMLMTREGSPMMKSLERIENADTLVANIVGGRKNARSQRVAVELETKPRPSNEEGREQVQTERADTPEGAAMIRKVKALKGRRVLIYKHNEEFVDGGVQKKMRVLLHVEDLGPARPFN